MDKELTPKQQTSEAIRQAEAILIMTGQHPSIDQVASTIALSAILRKYGKKVTAVISDDIPAGAKFLATDKIERTLGGLRDFIMQVDLGRAEVDKLKYTIENGKLNVHVTPFSGGFNSRDVSFGYGDYQFDLVIILGVASYNRIDKIYAQNAEMLRRIPLANIDFHRINEQYGAINLLETSAGSLAEILIALSESLQNGLIDEQIATTMLTGIMASTDRFTANHTTAKTMTVAAQMLAMGADQQKVVKGLYRDRPERTDRLERKPQPQSQSQSSAPRPNRTPERPAPQPVPMQAAPTPVPEPAPQPRPQAQPQPVVETPPQRQYQPPQPAPVPAPAAPEAQAARYDEPELPSVPAAQPAPEPAPEAPAETSPLEDSYDDDNGSGGGGMEELLPPHHIELSSDSGPSEVSQLVNAPEPLINDTSDRRRPARMSQPPKPNNPTNNPVFAQRLDEFEY